MTLELNIQAAQLDGYRVETHDNRLFFLARDAWRRGPYTSERDAWRHGGIPDYGGSKIEALAFARRVGFDASGIGASPEIVQAAIVFCTPAAFVPGADGEQPVIVDASEFGLDTLPDIIMVKPGYEEAARALIDDVPEFETTATGDVLDAAQQTTKGALTVFPTADGWTLDELRDQAKANGMTGYWKLNKQDLFDAIKAKVSSNED